MRWLLCLSAMVCTGCSAVVSLDPLTNGVCGERQKACSEACVPLDNPLYGCAAASCAPCAIPNTVAVCSREGQCAIAVCSTGYEDCDRQPENGCEVDLFHDPLHCGACTGAACSLPNADPICANRVCAIRTCQTGWGDCNGVVRDGCETDLNSTAMHCGQCRKACAQGTVCMNGTCR
jgi:hypothetical protein